MAQKERQAVFITTGTLGYTDKGSIWNGGAVVNGYMTTEHLTLISGVGLSKEYSSRNEVNDKLADYTASISGGATYPFNSQASANLTLSWSKKVFDHPLIADNSTFSAKLNFAFLLQKHLQLDPSIRFSESDKGEEVSVGIRLLYLGGW